MKWRRLPHAEVNGPFPELLTIQASGVVTAALQQKIPTPTRPASRPEEWARHSLIVESTGVFQTRH